jgi:hypothetical protein
MPFYIYRFLNGVKRRFYFKISDRIFTSLYPKNKIMRVFFTLTLTFLFSHFCLAQSFAINTDGSTANSSAILDVKSTTKGMLIPRMDSLQRAAILTPATGLLVYQTNKDSGFYYFDGTSWQQPVIATTNLWKKNGVHIYNGNTGNVGIGTNSPLAKLHVADSSVVFTATGDVPVSAGNTPVIGAGRRMMWFADKAAWRAGYVLGTNWDKDSIGRYSFAAGYNVKAKGQAAVSMGTSASASGNFSAAIGNFSNASGDFSLAMSNGNATDIYSIAIGENTNAISRNATAIGNTAYAQGLSSVAIGTAAYAAGNYSTAIGYNATTSISALYATALGNNAVASGENSTATGNNTAAIGFNSFTAGLFTWAKGNASFSVGVYNDISDNPHPIGENTTDRIFQIGNGTLALRSNAVTVLRNGSVGIGTVLPNAPLQFSNAYVDKKIALADFTNIGDNFFGFGVNPGILRYQVDHVLSNHVFYASTTELMRIQGDGNVGIGISNPGFLLNFPGALGDKISLFGNTGNHYGLGIQSSLLQIHTDASGSDIAFGYGRSAAFTELVRIKGNGNVGIGTPTPGFPLNFPNTLGDKISLYGNSGAHYGLGIQGGLFQIYSGVSTDDIAFGYGSSASFTEAMRVKGNGNVGIGTTNPAKQAEIIGAASAIPVTLVIGNRGGFGPAAMEFVSDYGLAFQWRPGYVRSNDIGGFTGALEFYTNGTGSGNLYGNVKGLEVRNGVTYTATGTVGTFSDERIKNNVEAFTGGLDIIKQINPVSFYYNNQSPFQTDKMQVGVLAQELEKIAPYMVDKNSTKDFVDLRSVNNQAYIFLLINAVKEQQKQLDEQRKLIEQCLKK